MLWYFYTFFLGLVVGSFANVVIYRIPHGESIVYGRSKCPDCGRKIAWYDLVPLVSFLWLKFRCRQCKRRISFAYPAVELNSGIIFALAFSFWGRIGVVEWLFTVFILESLLILALIDLKNLILPDSIMMMMAAIAIGYGFFENLSGGRGFNVLSVNNLVAAAILFLAFFLIWLLSKGAWLGLGDAKLLSLIGLIFGFWGGFLILYGAVILGVTVSLILLVGRKANLKTKLPLGTFISFSAITYIFLETVILGKLAYFFYFVPRIFK